MNKNFASIKDYAKGMVLKCTNSYGMFHKDCSYMVCSQDGFYVRLQVLDEYGVICNDRDEDCYCFTEEELMQYFTVTDVRPLSEKLAIDILSLFEDVLYEHQLYVPDEDREGAEEEACLYGTTYYTLQDTIASILSQYTDR